MGFAHVVLIDPGVAHLDVAYTYRIPEGMPADPGCVVRVPVRGRSRRGVVVDVFDEADVPRAQPIRAVLGPGVPQDVLDLTRAVAEHWLSSLGEALAHALPRRVADEEGVARVAPASSLPKPDLSWMQRYRGAPAILRAIERGGYAGFAWRPLARESRGQALASLVLATLERGRGALVMLPEVSYGSSVVAALDRALGSHLAWVGSDRAERERYRAWLCLRSGALRAAAGGRSAVFAPVRDLGLIVVDDESHVSFKARRTPRFHARAAAAQRARMSGATLLVVGTPPSAEVSHALERGALGAVLPSRADDLRGRPAVVVVDRGKSGDRLTPSARTIAALRGAVGSGGRGVLLVHRTGDEARRIAERAIRIVEPKRPARLDSRALAKDPAAFAGACAHADLLIASPVLAKDLELADIACVAVVEADAALAVPEFRAAEEAFATWWRVGRWLDGAGSLVLETAQPRHPAVVALTRWDPAALWRSEATRRAELGYPPYAALVRVDTTSDRATGVAAAIGSAAPHAEILGPVEREGRAAVIVRAADRAALLAALRPLAARWRSEGSDVRIDVDPREVLP